MAGLFKVASKLAKTVAEMAHELAQKRAALPTAKGGLGLPKNNTSEQRAEAQNYVDYYHGTQRLDRLLSKSLLDPKRATSGPMPYGTTTKELASGYALQKPDTSRIAKDEGDISNYFQVLPKDLGVSGRSPISVEKSWNFLAPEQKESVRKLAPRVGYENLDEFSGPLIVHPEGVNATLSPSQWDYLMKTEAKGNPLTALRQMWHDSGQLNNNEEELAKIYNLAGYKFPISQENAPWTEAQGVLLGKARTGNPINTSNNEYLKSIVPTLRDAFKRDRTQLKYGPDQWGKESRYTPKSWVNELEKDLSEGNESYVWTSIPDKVTEELKKLGHDSILDVSGKGGGSKEPVVIPFDPSQVRSRFAAFDPFRKSAAIAAAMGVAAPDLMAAEPDKKAAGGLSKAASLIRRVGEAASKAKPFYSALDEALSGLPNKALGDQFVKDLLKRGVKPQEIIDRNIDKILGAPIVQKTRTVNLKKPDNKGRTQIEEKYFEVTPSEKGSKSVSKADVEKAAAENPPPQLEEDVLFGERPESGMSIETSTHRMVGNRFVEGPEQHYVIDNKTGNTISGPHESYGEAQGRLSTIAEGSAGFEEQTLPNGTNYREIVMKLPGLTFEGTHYPKGTLAHARVSDRIGPNGEKMLHIEEIQSDLHQKGRKKGYSGNIKDLPSGYNLEEFILPNGSKEYRVNNPQGRLYSSGMSPESATRNAIENLNAGVPDAPFKNNWQELVMKRLLDDAARKGYDKVVMTPGVEQAKRYGQIKKIDRIEYKQEKDGNYYVIAAANDGSELFYKSQTLPELESLLGKDLAEKIVTGVGDPSQGILQSKSFNVEGLSLGGEGMKGFYDQMLPAFVNRYGEKTGLRMNLQDTPIQGKNFNVYEDSNANPFSVVPEGGSGIVSRHATREEADIAAAALGTQPLHSINITPEFRASVTEKGQPLYQMAPPAAVGAAASQDDPEESYNFITFRKGGEVNLDTMRLAVITKQLRKLHG